MRKLGAGADSLLAIKGKKPASDSFPSPHMPCYCRALPSPNSWASPAAEWDEADSFAVIKKPERERKRQTVYLGKRKSCQVTLKQENQLLQAWKESTVWSEVSWGLKHVQPCLQKGHILHVAMNALDGIMLFPF